MWPINKQVKVGVWKWHVVSGLQHPNSDAVHHRLLLGGGLRLEHLWTPKRVVWYLNHQSVRTCVRHTSVTSASITNSLEALTVLSAAADVAKTPLVQVWQVECWRTEECPLRSGSRVHVACHQLQVVYCGVMLTAVCVSLWTVWDPVSAIWSQS